MKSTIKKTFKTIGILLLALAVAVGILIALYYGLPARPTTEGVDFYTPKTFESRKEIEELFDKFYSYTKTTDLSLGLFNYKAADMNGAVPENSATSTDDSPESGGDDYSLTNAQVAGIDEADVVKTDGSYLYVRNIRGINIVSVSNGAMSLESVISVSADSFYVYNDYIVSIGTSSKGGTVISVYDTQNKQNPVLDRYIEHSGRLLTSRLKDGIVYYATSYLGSEYRGLIPSYRLSDSVDFIEQSPTDIYYFDGIPNRNYITLGRLDLIEKSNDVFKSYLGAGSDFYMSENNVYISAADYSERYYTNGLRSYVRYDATEKTRILKFEVSTLEFKAAGSVAGTVKDRYCLDEYAGNLRVATTVGWSDYSLVTVLDGEMKEIGKTGEIAPGESIYSCRFNGDSCSLVTFETVDPLFKIDLSDPTSPKVSEGLKKEGVSYYLHFIEGTDYLIGLGYDTVNGITKGIEVALFDNSGADAEIINVIIIGSSQARAEAISNPQAILYDKDRDMFGFAATIYSQDYSSFAESYYLFGFASGRLTLRATITHDASMDSRYEFIAEDSPEYYNSNYYVERAVQIGDYLYSISNRLIVSHSIGNDFEAEAVLEI